MRRHDDRPANHPVASAPALSLAFAAAVAGAGNGWLAGALFGVRGFVVALGWAAWVRGAVGVGIVLVLAFIDLRLLRKWSYLILLAAIGMLVVLMIVDSGRFVSRWITIGGFTFQPSEPAKIAVIMALAPDILTNSRQNVCGRYWCICHRCC